MLLNKFDIKHDVQIIIYDQTDIGDDLYRYIMFLNNDHYKQYHKNVQGMLHSDMMMYQLQTRIRNNHV